MVQKPLLVFLKQKLSSCLMAGTSITESGLTVSMERKSDEIVHFFRIDSVGGRYALDMINLKVCDCLVIYTKEVEQDEVLCFLELKGGRLDDAKEQIISTHSKVKQILRAERIQQNIIFKVCICMRQQAPSGFIRHEAELKRLFGKNHVRLKFGVKHYKELGDFFR